MFKSLVYSLITKGTVAIINFVILVVSSRYLGVSSRGEISIFILNITLIQILNEVYTGYSIVHFIPKFNFRSLVIFGFCYTLIFCSLSNLLVCFLNKQVPGYEWLGYVISLLVVLNTFNCVLILGRENIAAYNLLSFVQPFLLLIGIGVSVFLFKKFTFVSYVYPLSISFSTAFIISSAIVSGFFKKEDYFNRTFRLRPILANGLIFQSATLMYIFVNRYSYYLLPDIAKVGLYSSASSLMEALLIITNSISPILLARVSNQGNTLKSVDMTLALSKASVLFSVVFVFIVCMLPGSFFVFILGEGFSGIKDLMIVYAPGILMVSFFGTMSYYYSAIGKQKLVLACYSLGFSATLVLAPVLIGKFGSKGAAYSAGISYFLMGFAICSTFIVINKLSLKRFFSVQTDYKNLRELMSPPGHYY